MQTDYCGAVWTIVAILAGAGLKPGYQLALGNEYGEEITVSPEEIGEVF